MSTNSGGLEGGGPNPPLSQPKPTNLNLQSPPGQVSNGAPGGSTTATQRTFAQIIESEQV